MYHTQPNTETINRQHEQWPMVVRIFLEKTTITFEHFIFHLKHQKQLLHRKTEYQYIPLLDINPNFHFKQ